MSPVLTKWTSVSSKQQRLGSWSQPLMKNSLRVCGCGIGINSRQILLCTGSIILDRIAHVLGKLYTARELKLHDDSGFSFSFDNKISNSCSCKLQRINPNPTH